MRWSLESLESSWLKIHQTLSTWFVSATSTPPWRLDTLKVRATNTPLNPQLPPKQLTYSTKHSLNYPSKKPPNLKLSRLLLISFLILIMAFTMPTFLNRLMRPFSTSTRLGLNSDASSINVPEGAQFATIAAGCFWGVEHMYRKEFKGKGLYDARVGYIGGDLKNPNYRAVCSGSTGRMFSLYNPFGRIVAEQDGMQTPKLYK